MSMGTITVVNKYCGHIHDGKNNISIMRSYPLGNPFKIGEQSATSGNKIMDRADVIQAYKDWLRHCIEAQYPSIINALDDIAHKVMDGQDVNLICCCKPAACHGDHIKELIEGKLNETGSSSGL